MMASPHSSCTLCHQASKQESDAGPSLSIGNPPTMKPRKRYSRTRSLANQLMCFGMAATALAFVPMTSASLYSQDRDILPRPVPFTLDKIQQPTYPLSKLIQKRERQRRAYPANQILNFDVNVTPPQTCEPMNITFSTLGGSAPFTVFVGFSDWYAYTVELPASYADADVTTWLYQFDVPVFRPYVAPSGPTPATVVIVSDSTGNLMNSSSFQTVTEGDTSCTKVAGNVDFTFYNDETITACSPLTVNWQYSSPQPGWKDPLNIFLIPERAPPIQIPVTNSSAGSLKYNVELEPGTNVMLTMTDQGGSGGVSGENTVGGSEYIGQNCLAAASSSIQPIVMPSPTSTLSNLRMPDYTALVSSVITSDGVRKTSVAVETYRNGSSISSSGISAGRIAGLAAGIGLGAAIIAALVSWCVWRKRQGRQNLLWDIPGSVEGELSKRGGSVPIDQNFLRNRSKAMLRTGSATAPMLPDSTSPPSETSEERETFRRQGNMGNSEVSLTDLRYDTHNFSSQHSPLGSLTSSRPYGNRSNSQSNGLDGTDEGTNNTGLRRESGSSSVSNPFANAYAVPHSVRNYRQPHRTSEFGSEVDSMAMMDTNYGSSTRQPVETSAASFYDADYGSRPANPTYVQHSDAGLLLDDSLEEEEELGQHIELPPQYNSVPRRAPVRRGVGASRTTTTTNNSENSPNQTTDITSTAQTEYTDEDADDSKFWRSPPDT